MVAEPAEEADKGRLEAAGDMAGLDATDDGLARADISTRARPPPGAVRFAVGVAELDKAGDE